MLILMVRLHVFHLVFDHFFQLLSLDDFVSPEYANLFSKRY